MITYSLLLRGLVSLALVIGLLVLFVIALRRGTLKLAPFRGRAGVTIETATALGERRSLVIVAVEGRRLLLGLTPGNIAMITELAGNPPAASAQAPVASAVVTQ
jgi:flagellar protein FliO/FliZ